MRITIRAGKKVIVIVVPRFKLMSYVLPAIDISFLFEKCTREEVYGQLSRSV